jgi:hypothetical protein
MGRFDGICCFLAFLTWYMYVCFIPNKYRVIVNTGEGTLLHRESVSGHHGQLAIRRGHQLHIDTGSLPHGRSTVSPAFWTVTCSLDRHIFVTDSRLTDQNYVCMRPHSYPRPLAARAPDKQESIFPSLEWDLEKIRRLAELINVLHDHHDRHGL